jgi:hypothetical protein
LGRKPALTHHQQREAIKRLNAGKENAGRDCALVQCQPLDDFEARAMNAVHLHQRVPPDEWRQNR